MIGDMIAKVRKEKGITKTELARITGINIGHLTHIEKGERNPSHKALKNICKALDIPYQQLMYTCDKELNEDQETYNFIKHISYDKVPAIDKITNFIDCPSSVPSASFALKLNDNCMEPSFAKGTYLFIELNPILNNKDIGVFCLNNKILIRRFYSKKGNIVLKADNKEVDDIKITDSDTFLIIGKVLNKKGI